MMSSPVFSGRQYLRVGSLVFSKPVPNSPEADALNKRLLELTGKTYLELEAEQTPAPKTSLLQRLCQWLGFKTKNVEK